MVGTTKIEAIEEIRVPQTPGKEKQPRVKQVKRVKSQELKRKEDKAAFEANRKEYLTDICAKNDEHILVPSLCIKQALLDLNLTTDKSTDEEIQLSYTDLVANYFSLREELKNKLSTEAKEEILRAIETKQRNLTEYQDLSAYLNAPFPPVKDVELKDSEELDKLLKDFNELSLDSLDIPIADLDSNKLTERRTEGNGIFDHIASSIFNQLTFVRDKGLITKDEIAKIYSQFLVQGIQVASNHIIQEEQIKQQSWVNRVNAIQASIQLYEAKAQLLLVPSQLRLAYLQIKSQEEQLKLVAYQTQLEKEKIPRQIAETDLILAQIDTQRLQNEVVREQALNAKINNEYQVELLEEQTNAAKLNGIKLLEEINVLKSNIKKEEENLAFVKAQVAKVYAELALVNENIKINQAQYKDEIEGNPVKGMLGTQKNLHRMQTESFDRDSFLKFYSHLTNGWNTKKTADVGTKSPATFTAESLDKFGDFILRRFWGQEITNFIPEGGNYIDYLSDSQMDTDSPKEIDTGKPTMLNPESVPEREIPIA